MPISYMAGLRGSKATRVMLAYLPDPARRIDEIVARGRCALLSDRYLCEVLAELSHPVRIELITAFNNAACGVDLLRITPALAPKDSARLQECMRRYERIVLLLDPEGRYHKAEPMDVHSLVGVLRTLPREVCRDLAETYADAAIGFHEFFTTLSANLYGEQLRQSSLRFEAIRSALANLQ